jgi:putative ABC transport system ATP-binding protein
MKNTPIVQLTDIKKHYQTLDVITPVLQGISLTVHKGEFIAITGPSGSGKSTLMNIIGLLDTPSHGQYILNGSNTTGLNEDELAFVRNREIGFVFQSFNLLQRSSALENVMLPAIYASTDPEQRQARAVDLLTQVGLKDRMHNRPNQLSGGQQQRVAIARALMNNPELILADEPTGNLDSKSGTDVMNILKDLNKENKTIILITHEPDIAKQAQKTIFVRDGQIINSK